jgi:hypothetical protein
VIRAEDIGEIVVVFANRCGVEDNAVYAGTSCVLGINDGEVKVYGILGRSERKLLVVDTEQKPEVKLISEPNSATSNTTSTSETWESMDTQPTSSDRDEFLASIDAILAVPPVMSPRSPSRVDNLPFSSNDILETPKAGKGSNSDLSLSQSTPPVIECPVSPKSVNSSRHSSQNRSPEMRSRSSSQGRQKRVVAGNPINKSELDVLLSVQVPLAEDDSPVPSNASQLTLAVEIPKSSTFGALGTSGSCHSLLPPKSFARPASRNTSRMRTGLLPESPISMTQLDEEKLSRIASRNTSRIGSLPPEVIPLPDSPNPSAHGREERVAQPRTRKSGQRTSEKVGSRRASRPGGGVPTPKTPNSTNKDYALEVGKTETAVIVFMNSRDKFWGNVVPYSASYIQTAPCPWGEQASGLGPLPRFVVRRRHSLLW